MAPVHCSNCNTPLEAGARFCGVCGERAKEEEAMPETRPGTPTAIEREPSVPVMPNLFSNTDPYIGQTLSGRFQVESKLGEGGFGAVYRGTQKGTNRVVALKVLHPEMTRDATVVERFRREGQVLCRLRDAHTVTTYDFDQSDDGTLFIAMELLEGRSLHEVFAKESPIGWRRMLKILSQMCSSLAEAHQMGIVHRDLKPENVHLEERAGDPEFVKILDFGIAKMLGGDGIGGAAGPQLTATGQTLGTLEYMSPEQLMGKQLDGRSDIYGMGVLAFELMTGQLPFPDAVGPAMLISAQLKKIPPKPSSIRSPGEIPSAVDDLIATMLDKDRNKRFSDVGALRQACEEILRTQPEALDYVQDPPTERVQPMPQPVPVASEPGPSTRAIMQATAPRRLWPWFLLVILAGAGVAAWQLL